MHKGVCCEAWVPLAAPASVRRPGPGCSGMQTAAQPVMEAKGKYDIQTHGEDGRKQSEKSLCR